jgi:hypothetical protein
MHIGEHYKAAMFLAVNKSSFNCFCLKCWVYDFVMGAILDPNTDDNYKRTVINEHFAMAMDGADPKVFWEQLGDPNLN